MMISTFKDKVIWFYDYDSANDHKQKNPNWKHRYIKGLGSLTENEYDSIINDPQYDTVTVDDASIFQMMFGKDSALRKEYMFA
jgi:DNA gyrase/topoisomerase IV subunit B